MQAFVNVTIAMVGLQGVLFGYDELKFHRLRGLSTFERWGHPIDSLLFFVAVMVPGFLDFSQTHLYLYAGLAVLSGVAVTKDEWIHVKECEGLEVWVHSLMFLLHASVLWALGILWFFEAGISFRKVVPFLILGAAVYQFIVWVIFGGKIYGKITHAKSK